MARIHGARCNQGGLIRRMFVGLVYALTRRRLGRIIMPVQVTAHHSKILKGYIQIERSQAGERNLPGADRQPQSLLRRF